MIKYDKLVRNKIPEIIKADGGECKFRSANKEEFVKILNDKLIEEVQELIETPCAEEIADVLEVIEMLGAVHRINLNEIRDFKQLKRKERGSFSKMIILEEATKQK